MLKNIISTAILLNIFCSGFTQTISPSLTTEFCPNQNVVFTVRLPEREPGSSINVTALTGPAGSNNPSVVQIVSNVQDTTFAGANGTKCNFTGRFGDDNIKQTFKVAYTPKGATQQFPVDFAFKYIKSLKNPSPVSSGNGPCKLLNLGSSPITVPLGNIQNIPLNFNNIKWSTKDEGNDFCWGVIRQYEYLIPQGWSIGTTTSNGTTWILDDSSVVITSNICGGYLGKIRVRPANAACGVNLINNADVREINIDRPKPSLTFIGTSTICSSATFQANGVPSWVNNTLWSVSPSSLVSISSPTSNPTIFTTVGNGTGTVNFTINGGASCPLSFNYNTQEIVNKSQIEAGAPVTTWPEIFYPTTNCLPMGFNVTYTTTSQFQPYYYEWGYYEGPSGNGNPYVLVGNGGTQQAIRITNTETINRISVKAINACGAGIPNIREFTFSTGCDGGGDVEYKIKPKEEKNELTNYKFEIVGNPVSSLLTLNIPFNNLKKQIQISDLNGKVLITIANTNTSLEKVDISKLKSGLYFVTLLTGNKKQVLKFVKQ
jgi:hypothetical protein